MKNILITMSGGTTAVINATLAGIIISAQRSKKINRIYAGIPGLLGVLDKKIIDLTDISKEDIKKLKKTPSSGVIGTTRVKKFSKDEFKFFKQIIKEYKISYFINIGGNGTVKQTKSFVENIKNLKAISLPKTVDNDLGDIDLNQMFFTPGFPSVINYWYHKILMMNNENMGAYSHDKVIVAQTFGRETGFIAGSVRLADPKRKLPLLILLPEDQKETKVVIDSIKNLINIHGRALVVMSEGYNVGDLGAIKDFSGQIMYGSSKNLAAQVLVNKLVQIGIQARAFIPGIDQRSEIKFTTKFDIKQSYKLGKYTIDQIEKGNSNFLVGIKENKGNKVIFHNINFDTFKDLNRKLDQRFIRFGQFDVTDDYLFYLKKISNKRDLLIENEILDINSFYNLDVD